MAEILQIVFKVSVVLFMVGNLLDMGLRLRLQDALMGLRNARFMALSLLWGFVLCPGLAWLFATVIPMHSSYGVGLILLGMVPCAPYLPLVAEKSHGDLGYAAAMMLLAAVGTVVFMPFAVPHLATGLTTTTWTIAKPLLLFILIPLLVGMAFRAAWKRLATELQPVVKTTTSIATVVLLLVTFVMFGRGFVGAIGSYLIGAQILYFTLVAIAPQALGFGLLENQKSILSLGLASRNIGAAVAPLMGASHPDQLAIVSVLVGLPISVIASFLLALWFGRRAANNESATELQGSGKTNSPTSSKTHTTGRTMRLA